MAAEAGDPAPDSPARTVLLKQSRLMDADLRLRGWQIARERAGLVLQSLTASAGLVLAAAVGWLVWDASRADGLVIEAFSVPPALAADGLTGEVVAAQLQDALGDLQARTQSTRAAETLANNWAGDVAVEIPQTGVSVGELRSALREWLGRETRVVGAVVRTPTGLRVTARVSGQPGDTAIGADLDTTLPRVAEGVLRRTQPYRYGIFLRQNGRQAEARAVLARLAVSGPASERSWALTGLAGLEPDLRAQILLYRRALELDPHHGLAWSNMAFTQISLGHYEAALRSGRRALEVLEQRDHGGVSAMTAEGLADQRGIALAFAVGDAAGALRLAEREAARPGFYGSDLNGTLDAAAALALMHRPMAARLKAASVGATDAAVTARVTAYGRSAAPYALSHAALDDWPAALRELELLAAALAADPVLAAELGGPTGIASLHAKALARSGRLEEAAALIATTATDCYECLRARGEIASLRSDTAAADRWFAEAVRQGPSLPHAYSEWGEAKLARGDLEGALRLFRKAQKRAPRWADPLKFEGDALAIKSDHRDALRRYEAALERAPQWGAAHLAAGRTLSALRGPERAAQAYRRALRLDLSAADRAEALRRLADQAA